MQDPFMSPFELAPVPSPEAIEPITQLDLDQIAELILQSDLEASLAKINSCLKSILVSERSPILNQLIILKLVH